MLRHRFSTGLLLGLFLGLPAGAFLMFLAPAERAHQPSRETMLQIEELTRRLETAKEERERADKQLERFQKLAEQMATTFNTLEGRFRALEEAERSHQARPQEPPASGGGESMRTD